MLKILAMLPLLLLSFISLSGLLLFAFKKIHSWVLNLLIALGTGSMLAVSLVHILPESLEQTENAVYAFLGGFLLIYIVEEWLTPHKHDHSHGDHSHEDPHEHYDHVAIISWVAIFGHTLLDGLGIRAGMNISDVAGYAILFGVAVHQIPVSLSLAAIFRESRLKKKYQILFLSLFALAAPTGYMISDIFMSTASITTTGFAVAFAGGSLLYVATADLLPMIHSQSKNKYATIGVFLFGVISMSYLASHNHGDDPTKEILSNTEILNTEGLTPETPREEHIGE